MTQPAATSTQAGLTSLRPGDGGPPKRFTRRRATRLYVLIAGVALGTACASVTINKVLADPTRYRDREVTLSGQVSDSYSLGSRGAYRLRDDSGQLWVISEQGVPRTGAEVKVTGRIREGYNVGSLGARLPAGLGSGVVLLESSHRAK